MIPLLKWAGGKRWLIPELMRFWNPEKYSMYIEPFAGGLAYALNICPKCAIINDINPHLINFYKWVKRGLISDISMKNDEKFYYVSRDRFNELIATQEDSTKEAALLFYYLNRTGFNGLCRFNKSGYFNVPFGTYKNINYKTDFNEYKKVFRKWKLMCGDFGTIPINKNDFVYLDPPYDVDFVNYSKEGFGWEDQIRLAKWASSQECIVLISNQATDRIIELYHSLKFAIILLDAPRLISCNGNRDKVKEILAVKGDK